MSTVLQGHIQRPALLCSLGGRISIICTRCPASQRASRRARFSNNNFHGLINGQCFASTHPLGSHSNPKGGLDTLLEGNKPAAFPGERPAPGAPSSAGAVTPSPICSIPLGHPQYLCYPLQLFGAIQWVASGHRRAPRGCGTRRKGGPYLKARISYSCEKIRASWRLEFPQLFIP